MKIILNKFYKTVSSIVVMSFLFSCATKDGQQQIQPVLSNIENRYFTLDLEKESRFKKENNIPHQDSFKNIIERGYESNIWADEASKCVECGACNTICPTCHCFLLYDQKSENQMARLRIWDSCMIKDYAQVAGGANPRPELWMRLRNSNLNI